MAISGMKFTHSAHINPSPKPKPEVNSPAAMWGMLAAGLAIGFLGMYVTVTRPMSMRMQMVESNVSLMQTDMNQLVGTRDELWKTNDLLTGLRHQQRQLEEAKLSLVAMREMKNSVMSLAKDHQMAMSSIQSMESLQAAILENESKMSRSHEAVASMNMLQKSVMQLGSSAQDRQMEIVAVSKTMDEMKTLTTRMIEQKEMIAVADTVIDSVDKLSASLMQREEPLAHSTAIVKQIESLQDSLVQQAEMMPASEKTVQEMAELEMNLARIDNKVAVQANKNMAEMMKFQKKLTEGGGQIAAAIETIELLEGFQSEIEVQARSLSKMRRDLMEVTVLESTVNQTLQVLKPLIQLSDLKRMNDTEVREAARAILDRRIADSRGHKGMMPTRMAEQKIESPQITPKANSQKEPRVPTPTDLE